MNNQIFSLVYCSRNEIRGTSEEITSEIRQILLSARNNNSKVGVTGALVYNEGIFAQVLEGPSEDVERIFEKIQYDSRHSDVTVLQSGLVDHRSFPDWSMAFASTGDESKLENVTPVFRKAFLNPSASAEPILSMLHDLVVQEDCMMGV